VHRDDDIRSSCFASLDVLCATFGEDVPYRGGLDAGFPFRARRVPFFSQQKGIFRAAAQRGPAALSIQTSWKSPYADEELDDGFRYAFRAGELSQPDNRSPPRRGRSRCRWSTSYRPAGSLPANLSVLRDR
jgi:hypothetical protein